MSEDEDEDRAIKRAYSKLAAAIIASGEAANDQVFLKSNWCEALKLMVQLRTGQGGSPTVKKENDVRLYTGILK